MTKNYFIRALILVASLVSQLGFFSSQSHAAAGDLDLSFDAGSGVNGPVTAVALQPDGKVIIGGTFTAVKDVLSSGVARLNADGSGDSNFTAAPYGAPYGEVYALALQPDGKVLVGHQYGYARLNSNGSLDATFLAIVDIDYGVTRSITVLSDGKLLVGGYMNGLGVARLHANGSVDATFNVWPEIYGTSGASVYSLALQSDGKLLVGGQWNNHGGTNNGIVRLNSTGSLDPTFSPGSGVSATVYSVAVQSDGKVLIGGDFSTVNGTNRNRIARLNATGGLDITFGSVTGANTMVSTVAVQPDGKVLIGGELGFINGTNRSHVARLDSDGALDLTFNPGTGLDRSVSSLVRQSDGKMIVGGSFTTVNGTNRNSIARLNSNGSLDASFDSGRAVRPGGLVPQLDGKVIVGNIRLNADGSFDSIVANVPPTNSLLISGNPTFPGSNYVVTTCGALQPDGKSLMGGYFVTEYVDFEGGVTRWSQPFLTRFHTNGSRDTNFTEFIGSADYGLIDAVLPILLTLQPDGKMLFAARYGFMRFNTNGASDADFTASVGQVHSIRLQTDGRIFITGAFGTVNGTNRGGMARLNSNGSLDNSFNPGTGANGPVSSFIYQPDGKLLIWGSFTSINGTNRNRVARLHADGSLDSIFNPGAGPNGSVFAMAVQPNGDVLISGNFLTVDGVLRPSVARLYGDSPWPSLNLVRSNSFLVASWPVMGLGFQLQMSTNLSLPNAWSPVLQSLVTNGNRLSASVPAGGPQRFFRLHSQ